MAKQMKKTTPEAERLQDLRMDELAIRLDKLITHLGINHDIYFKAGECQYCDMLREDFELEQKYEKKRKKK